ncbi:hypothetical protein TREMEDRAFT_62696 [Tremella mesenterica DSM 1558]|uniref:uncharacterized protein n=1 Tax=Tremella mesenterica (strain ATCC 24925 / CBS 8224 / DSM 1558 / NBRC 9311 / NRRL Y-6157 / RJB 2259-6 / UBC 559-6) TaxID=578456 RepID=UPI0003F49C5E|nr:uncharacterized protein TREMEDRAFT_62696 [Tremella mesenterica DSM 1558]EIW68980.1 hypothetical protein TREMEDRAFT_62696 [Tremella mesenterica DSM 1558]
MSHLQLLLMQLHVPLRLPIHPVSVDMRDKLDAKSAKYGRIRWSFPKRTAIWLPTRPAVLVERRQGLHITVTCTYCKERWFGMQVEGGRRTRCRANPAKWTAENNMDPGKSLQELCQDAGMVVPETPSQVEEMLLSPYHVLLQTWRVGGGQTKYGGHTCLYVHDRGRFLSRLPLTVTELDILIIKPPTHQSHPHDSSEEFSRRPEFQVKRSRILANLHALQRFHPDYRNIQIDWDALNQLPINGSVLHQLRSVVVDNTPDTPVNPHPGPSDEELPEEDSITEGVIPNLGEVDNVIEDVREALNEVAGNAPMALPLVLTGPMLQSTPVNEHDISNPFLTRAFPFLFPTGQADLNQPRSIKVRDADYFRHLLRYKDGRFAQHPRFRYYAFNCVMRWRAKRLSGFYVSRNDEDRALSAADIAAMLRRSLKFFSDP